MPARPIMNSQSAHAAPAIELKNPAKGPSTLFRNPVVGDPPRIQARSPGVAWSRPNILSRNAQKKTNPSPRRVTASV